MQLLSNAMSHFMCEDYSVQTVPNISSKICTEYLKILENIHRCAVHFNTKDYQSLIFILRYFTNICEKIENYLSRLFSTLPSKIPQCSVFYHNNLRRLITWF